METSEREVANTVSVANEPSTQEFATGPFAAAGANQLWEADITFVPTVTGFLFLAVVLDAWSRKIVGSSMAYHLRAELVIDALEMAVSQRKKLGR